MLFDMEISNTLAALSTTFLVALPWVVGSPKACSLIITKRNKPFSVSRGVCVCLSKTCKVRVESGEERCMSGLV